MRADAAARTDDLGQYRFANVPPGCYDVETRDNFGGQHPLVDRSAEGSPHLLAVAGCREIAMEVSSTPPPPTRADTISSKASSPTSNPDVVTILPRQTATATIKIRDPR